MSILDYQKPETATWHVGTLSYTRAGLVRLFVWLLLGDFCWMIMETSLPMLLGLTLQARGETPQRIAWVLSIGNLMALICSPFIGVWSDRLRTRLGRRRPFLLLSTPVMAIGLMLIPHVHNFWLLNALVILIQFANVMQTVVFYLYADVVPGELMGRFLAAMRFVGLLGALAFQVLLVPHFDASPVMVWTICGLVYLIAFQLMLHFVKEGTYPDPEKVTTVEVIKDYIKVGLSTRYIWLLWLALGMTALGGPAVTFYNLLAKDTLKMDAAALGYMTGWGTALSLALALPAGWLVDRIGPRLLWAVFGFGVGMVQILGFFYVKDVSTMKHFFLVLSGLNAVLGTVLMPMLYAHLPKGKFGQLVSTQSLVVQFFLFVSTNILGWLVARDGNNYFVCFLYGGFFYAMIPVMVLGLRYARSPFKSEELAMPKA